MNKKLLLIFLFLEFSISLFAQNIWNYTSVKPTSQTQSLVLPSTHTFQMLIQTGDLLTDGSVMPISLDFAGFLGIAGSSTKGYLNINSETFPGGVTILDIQRNPISGLWQVDSSNRVDFSGIVGTAYNCSGNITPWNTMITCEETVILGDANADGFADYGWCIEIDPVTRKVMDYNQDGTPDKLWQMGRMMHENIVIANDDKTVYYGEDRFHSGFVYKYVCDSAQQLQSGDLYFLQIDSAAGGTTGTWIPLNNKSIAIMNHAPANANIGGATLFYGVEDLEIGPDSKVYFSSKYLGKVFRFKDDGATISEFETFVGGQNYDIDYGTGTANIPFGTGADNLAFDNAGNLWILQDELHTTDSNFIWMVKPTHTQASPQIELFATFPKGSEPTGISFSPDGRFMYLSIMHPAVTNTITQTDVANQNIIHNKDITAVIALKEDFLPEISIANLRDTIFCDGDSTILKVVQSSDKNTYQWFQNNVAISGKTDSILIVYNSGKYHCEASNLAGTRKSNAFQVTKNLYPNANISASDVTTFCQNDSVILNANFNSNWIYQWQKNGSDISGKTNFNLKVENSGIYQTIINNNNCIDTSNQIPVTVNALPIATISALNPTTFCLGDSINLKANFESGFSFQWKKDGVNISGANDSLLKIKQTGNYEVEITDGNSCKNSSNQISTNAIGPTASISALGTTTFCNGDSVLIQANAGVGFSYQWLLNDVPIAGANQINYFAKNAGNYTCQISDGMACSSLSNSISVSINALPNATINSMSNTTFCAGDSVILQGNSASAYQWFLDGNAISGSNSMFFTAKLSGNYTLEITDGNACKNISAPENIVVNPSPPVNAIALGNTTFCDGDDVLLQGNSAAGLSYQWQFNGVDLAGEIFNIIYADSAGNYTLKTTNIHNCSAVSNPILIQIYALPDAGNVSTNGGNLICQGDSILLEADAGVGLFYQWEFNGLPIAGATDTFLFAKQTGTYELLVSDAFCTNSADSSTIMMTQIAAPIATISALNSTTFCLGDSINLKANYENGFLYQWKKDGINISGANDSLLKIFASGTYEVEITDSNSCQNSSNQIVANAIAPPAMISAAGITTFCSGDSVNLQANSGMGFSYQWFLNGNAISGANQINFSAKNSGNYSCQVSDSMSCSSLSNSISVLVNALPIATINPLGNTEFCDGDSVILQGNSASAYQWFLDGNAISSSDSMFFVVKVSGNYSLEITDSNACKNISPSEMVVVNALPIATISSLNSTTFCLGDSIDLKANYETGFSFQWKKDSVNISGANDSLLKIFASGTYEVEITDSNACQNSSNQISANVNVLPMAQISVSGNTNACAGDSILLEAYFETGYSYQWFMNGNALASANDSNFMAYQTGNYFVEITDSNTCKNISNTILISIDSLPNAQIFPLGNTTFCQGDSLILKGNSEMSLDYEWKQNGTTIGTNDSLLKVLQTGNYELIISRGNLCFDTSNAVFVQVNLLPNISISNLDTTDFCFGDSVILQANNSNLIYQWKRNNQDLPTDTNFNLSVFQSGIYELLARDSNACQNLSNTISVNVLPLPNANLDTLGNVEFCFGDSVVLKTKNNFNTTFQWKNNGATIPNEIDSFLAIYQSGNFKVILKNQFNCVDSSQIISTQVNTLPAAPILPNTFAEICFGDSLALKTSNLTHLNYQWFKNGNPILLANDSIYLVKTTGNYVVIVSDTNNCSQVSNQTWVEVNPLPQAQIIALNGTTFCPGDSIDLSANNGVGLMYQWQNNGMNIPAATNSILNVKQMGNFAVLVSDTNNCQNLSNQINTTILTAPAKPTISKNINMLFSTFANSYQWIFNGNAILGANNQTYHALQSGIYAVRITKGSDNCWAISDTLHFTFTGIEKPIVEKLKIYPNPAQNQVQVSFELSDNQLQKIDLSNVLGQIFYEKSYNSSLQKFKETIDLTDLSAGIYFLKIETSKGILVREIVVQE